MGWSTYIIGVRLRDQTWYYPKRFGDRLSDDYPLLRSPSGAVLFDSIAGAKDAAARIGEALTEAPVHVNDLDGALAWCARPTSNVRDWAVLVCSWSVLIDFGILEFPLDRNDALERVFDKLHLNYAYQETKEEPRHDLTWTDADLTLLATTLRDGIDRFIELLPTLAEESG